MGTIIVINMPRKAATQLPGKCDGTSWIGCLLPHKLCQRLAISERVQAANNRGKLLSL